MKAILNLPQELITGIDVMNTVNGGMTEPFIKLEQFTAHRQITLRVPGIGLENIKIEINNNKLMILCYSVFVSQQKVIWTPRVVYNKVIPYFVDAKNITARQEEKSLVVRLPFNELFDGYHRDVSITK